MDLALEQVVVGRHSPAVDPVRHSFAGLRTAALAQERGEMEAERGREAHPRLVVSRAPNMVCPTDPT